MTDLTETASDKSPIAKKNDGTTYSVRETESVTEAVVRAVSAENKCHPLDIEPIHSVIETDALDMLFAPQTNCDRRLTNQTVAFRYSDCDVRVTENREIIVEKSEAE